MTEPQTLMTGIALGESPRWHEGRLWFSDWGAQEIVAASIEPGLEGSEPGAHRIDREVITRISSVPFSIDWQPDGRLLVVSGSNLLRQEQDGSLASIAVLSGISTKPWNEIVVDGRGHVYLNNIGFDFPGGEFAPGIVAMVGADGAVRQVADGVAFPNGMAITPDNSTLILAESYGNRLTAFDIAADGALSNQRTWAELGTGTPDGICIDDEGAVWYADVPNQHCVRVCEGGEVLQTIEVGLGCFACMLGGPDGKTLYVMAADWPGALQGGDRTGRVVAARVPAAGAGWPSRTSR